MELKETSKKSHNSELCLLLVDSEFEFNKCVVTRNKSNKLGIELLSGLMLPTFFFELVNWGNYFGPFVLEKTHVFGLFVNQAEGGEYKTWALPSPGLIL